jgi:hypothetical protein
VSAAEARLDREIDHSHAHSSVLSALRKHSQPYTDLHVADNVFNDLPNYFLHECPGYYVKNKNKTPWLVANKRTILFERPPRPAKLVLTFAGRGSCVVSATNSLRSLISVF